MLQLMLAPHARLLKLSQAITILSVVLERPRVDVINLVKKEKPSIPSSSITDKNFKGLQKLFNRCTNTKPSRRPSTKDIYNEIESLKQMYIKSNP